MEKEYILVIDQGTTGTRAVIYDNEANIIGYKYKKHKQIYPKPGWVEHDPLEIWNNTITVIKEVINATGIDKNSLVSIGITNQRETTILWDKETGKPVYNAIVWQDTRTDYLCKQLIEKGLYDKIHEITGLFISTYFSATKIKWIITHIPEAKKYLEENRLLFGTIDTWIIWKLTEKTRDNITPDRGGAHVIDYSNASRTMLFDIRQLKWSREILDVMNIPEDILPKVVYSSTRKPYGYTNPEIFGARIPIHGDLGDQQAALVGQTCFDKGQVKSTYGTGAFILLNIGDEVKYSKKGLLTTIGYVFEKQRPIYALEGSIAIAGAAIQWLIENLELIKSPAETEELAKKAYPAGSGGVYFVPAFSGLFAPYWDVSARGLIIGLTKYTRKEHLVHAVLESIAYQVRDIIETMQEETRISIRELRVDGGVTRNNYLMQLQANILGIPIIKPVNIEITSLGAAFAAGIGSGVWKDLDELRSLWKIDKVYEPKWSYEKREKLYHGWKIAVKRAMRWLEEAGNIPPSSIIEE